MYMHHVAVLYSLVKSFSCLDLIYFFVYSDFYLARIWIYVFVRDGILSVADYNSTLMGAG